MSEEKKRPPNATEDDVCADCGYTRDLHRAYAFVDRGGPGLEAHLGGHRHPFRAPAPRAEDKEGGQ